MRNVILLTLVLFISNSCFSQDYESKEFEIQYLFKVQGKTSKVAFVCLVPNDIEGIQKINRLDYSIEPVNIFFENGNKYAEFLFKNVKLDSILTINIKLDTYKRDLKVSKKNPIFQDMSKDMYLNKEKYIETADPNIMKIADMLRDTDSLKTVKNIYNYIKQNIQYSGIDHREVGALKTLKLKKGDCSDFSDLFVALCRTNGYNARIIEGYVTEFENSPLHAWAEVYIPKYGWIRIDPTPGNDISFSELKNTYIQLTSMRNDSILHNGHRWRYTFWGDAISVIENIKFLK